MRKRMPFGVQIGELDEVRDALVAVDYFVEVFSVCESRRVMSVSLPMFVSVRMRFGMRHVESSEDGKSDRNGDERAVGAGHPKCVGML